MFVDLQYVTIFEKKKERPVNEKNRILFYCFVAFFCQAKMAPSKFKANPTLSLPVIIRPSLLPLV